MKYRLSLAILGGLALVGFLSWAALAGDGPNQSDAESTATTSTFHLTGMTCGGCEVGVRRVVNKLQGIEDVAASHKEATATVTYQADEVTPEDIIAAIAELGYGAELAEFAEDGEGKET